MLLIFNEMSLDCYDFHVTLEEIMADSISALVHSFHSV